MTIYFIGDGGYIKIGYTGGDVRKRLSQLQTGSSRALQLVATIDGGPEKEVALHQQFATHRIGGEWFAVKPDSLHSVDGIQFAKDWTTARRKAIAVEPSDSVRSVWVSLRSQVERLEKEADEINGQSCRALAMDWFREAYNRVQFPSGLAMLNKNIETTLQRAHDSEQRILAYGDRIPVNMRIKAEPGKPWIRQSHFTSSTRDYEISSSVICALNKVIGISRESMQYEPATHHYKKYKKYFSCQVINEESWKWLTKEVLEKHGDAFVNQYSDAFEDYINRVIVWAHLENDSRYLRLGASDERKYFNALILGYGMGRIKNRIQESTGQYISEPEAALGLHDWARDYCMGAEYNDDEESYRIRT